ncbi:MAG: RNA polymerase sigma factor [Odoribacter sp.]|nr:RNA polymerase sigma factor [Odoribacter sp.]
MNSKSFQARIMAVQDNLLNFAYMLTANHDDAYDLLQDTTLKVLENEDKYVENTNFKGWAFTIMRNLFINNYRRRARSKIVVDRSDDLYQINMSQSSGFESPEGAMSSGDIHLLIDKLSDDMRIPFSLHLAGYKYKEIAEYMNQPVGTIKSRIFFARKQLQKALTDYR